MKMHLAKKYISGTSFSKLLSKGLFQGCANPSCYDTMLCLIDEFNIHVTPIFETECDSYGNVIGYHYYYEIIKVDSKAQNSETLFIGQDYPSYDDALYTGIEKAIELI